jgi:hypothetical protein
MLALIDNPLIRKYVVLGVNYNTYLNHKNAFEVDFDLACIQDFTFINDIYSKVDNIYNEGIFNYIVVSGCKEKDSNFFLENDKDNINILVFEEE